MSERTNIDRLADTVAAHFHRPVPAAPVESLRELVALAGRADELERENERLRRDPKTHPFSTGMDLLRRAEAAEARADELQRLAEWRLEQENHYRERADELQRERDAARDMLRWRIERYKQARREADQLRAALRRIADRYCLHAKGDAREASVCLDKPVDQWCSVCVARAVLAGVQAEEEADTRWFLCEGCRRLTSTGLVAQADRAAELEAALRETRKHLRPDVGGRFDQHAAVDAIDRALAGDGGGA
jgi:hypothetical protein